MQVERLQKYLSNCGVASRRKSEELILEGKVKVNGNVINTLGYKVDDKDIVTVNDVEIKKSEFVYYLLYKPEKVITSVHDEKGRITVVDLINTKEKIYPVGRLDYDTSGLLLLTNDGNLTNLLTHPSHNVEKTYYAKIDGIINIDEVKELEKGILVEITISEGRNHQVKNMFMYFNHKVLKLKRTNYSFLNLNGLKVGEYRKLSIKEVKKLYSLN